MAFFWGLLVTIAKISKSTLYLDILLEKLSANQKSVNG
jgi:hypothetical protein